MNSAAPPYVTSPGVDPAAAAGAQLTGALDTVALADVLQLLELGRKTGVLAVDGGEGRRGLVRLADGAIAGARYEVRAGAGRVAATADVTQSVGALLALPAGRFAFTPAVQPAAPGTRLRVEAVLMAALHAADERARPAATPPGPDGSGDSADDRVLVLAAATTGGSGLSLRSRHWAVLAAVDGRRDVAQIAAACGVARVAAEHTLVELCDAGLVACSPAAGGDVPPAPACSSGT